MILAKNPAARQLAQGAKALNSSIGDPNQGVAAVERLCGQFLPPDLVEQVKNSPAWQQISSKSGADIQTIAPQIAEQYLNELKPMENLDEIMGVFKK